MQLHNESLIKDNDGKQQIIYSLCNICILRIETLNCDIDHMKRYSKTIFKIFIEKLNVKSLYNEKYIYSNSNNKYNVEDENRTKLILSNISFVKSTAMKHKQLLIVIIFQLLLISMNIYILNIIKSNNDKESEVSIIDKIKECFKSLCGIVKEDIPTNEYKYIIEYLNELIYEMLKLCNSKEILHLKYGIIARINLMFSLNRNIQNFISDLFLFTSLVNDMTSKDDFIKIVKVYEIEVIEIEKNITSSNKHESNDISVLIENYMCKLSKHALKYGLYNVSKWIILYGSYHIISISNMFYSIDWTHEISNNHYSNEMSSKELLAYYLTYKILTKYYKKNLNYKLIINLNEIEIRKNDHIKDVNMICDIWDELLTNIDTDMDMDSVLFDSEYVRMITFELGCLMRAKGYVSLSHRIFQISIKLKIKNMIIKDISNVFYGYHSYSYIINEYNKEENIVKILEDELSKYDTNDKIQNKIITSLIMIRYLVNNCELIEALKMINEIQSKVYGLINYYHSNQNKKIYK